LPISRQPPPTPHEKAETLIERIVEVAGDLVRSGSRVTVHDQGKALVDLSKEVHKRIGARLRHLYDAP
jgi:hypothetical protein